MKKRRDLTPEIMGNIADLEKKRIGRYRRIFWSAIAIIVTVATFMGVLLWQNLSQRGTFELFSLFTEDIEVVREYFGDVAVAFVSDLPYTIVAVGIVCCMVLVVTFFLTGKRRRIDRLKVTEIEKYTGNRDTKKAQKKENV